MVEFLHTYFRRMALALMLLLTASANCLSVSYDANQDDEIPPVTVHFCFVSSGKRMAAGKRSADSVKQASRNILETVQDCPVMTAGQGFTQLHTGSPNLVVPLRR